MSISQEGKFVSVPTVCHIFCNYKTCISKQGGLIALNTGMRFIERKYKMNTIVKGLIYYHVSMPHETGATIISRKLRKVQNLVFLIRKGQIFKEYKHR